MENLTRPGPAYDEIFRLLEPCPNCGAMWLALYRSPSADHDASCIWCRACSSSWTGKSDGEANNNLQLDVFSRKDPDEISGKTLDALVWNEVYEKRPFDKGFSPSTKVEDAEAVLEFMRLRGYDCRCTGVQINGGGELMGMLGYTIFIWRRDNPNAEWKRITGDLVDWPAIVCRTALDAVRSERPRPLRMNG